MADRGVKHVERNKEGVPMWDEDPTTFTEYAEMADHWQQSVAYHKRYLCGPKLQAELSGSARRFVMSMAPGWISFDGGVDRLLNHLRMHLGQPQLSEMSDYMARYFKMSKRKRHETMNEYITRKAELYMRACQSLDRVQQRYEPEKSKQGSSTNTSSRPPSRPGVTTDFLNSLDGDVDFEESHHREDQPQVENDPWAQWQKESSQWWQSEDWHSGGWWTDSWENQTSRHYMSAETYGKTMDLLPSFVQGWFLLQDAGLDPNERNMILAALRNDFSVDRVAQELRNQWTDDDVRKRDQGGRASAWSVDQGPSDDESLADGPDWATLAQSGMNEEGMSILNDAEDEAQQALVQLDRNRRTLREARAKQHYVKMSRQYYRSSTRPTTRPPAQYSKEDGPPNNVTCLSCGGNHRTSQCPKKPANHSTAATAEAQESAPFICYAQERADNQTGLVLWPLAW